MTGRCGVVGRGAMAMALATGTLLAACSGEATGPQPSPVASSSTPAPSPTCDRVAAVAKWGLAAQVSQLLFGGIYTDDGASAMAAAERAVTDGAMGGLNFLGGSPQIYADGQLDAVTEAAGDIPPFLAVDQEGGRVQRLQGLIGDRPAARRMGEDLTAEEVRAIGRRTGEAMSRLGLSMNLAPVVDVSAQPDNSVAGDRSFSADPAAATRLAGAYANGLRDAGIVPVLKHFPGLGSASGNTDFEPATTPPLEQLRTRDLIPYRTLTRKQPVAVMMATAIVPGLTDGEQAGLSAPAVELLRGEIGFDGVVMTDSLSGAAVAQQYSLPEAAERAIGAGVDMVLWDSTAEAAAVRDRLVSAVRAGRIPAEQVAASVDRVLALKGLDPCTLPPR